MNNKKMYAKTCSLVLTAAMVISTITVAQTGEAKVNSISLSKKNVSITVGSKKKVTVKNTTKSKITSVSWTVNKAGKKIVKLTKKTKSGVTIKGLKKGKATVTAKIKATKGIYQKSVKVIVQKKQNVTPAESEKPTETEHPVETEEPSVTKKPEIYGEAGKVSAYDVQKTNYTLNIDSSNKVHDISELLYGIFIEDINFAADGGLYAEMVQNRSFEFTKLAAGNEKHAWSDVGKVTAEVVKNDDKGCLNVNNPNYMVLENKSAEPSGISNVGFLDGMSIVKDAKYKFSIYARGLDGYTGPVRVAIMNGKDIAAEGTIETISAEWKKYELTLTSSVTSYKDVQLRVMIHQGKAAIDMVSLFPEDTFKGRENGLRKDLAEKLEALNPAFLRFPGGCVVEGVNLDAAYEWKDSIGVGSDGEPLKFNGTYGDVATRKQGQNIWTNENTTEDKYPCFMSYGLGFYEYFQLAEDLGAIGVPVVNCGISCMIGNPNAPAPDVNSKEFKRYVQDALDLVEFCRGDESTKWGAVRVALGHKDPFELKYIGIGNEQWGNRFFQHYEAFVDAFDEAKAKNPELYGGVELMFSAGVDDGDSGIDYMPAYKEAADWLAKHPGKTINDFAGAIDHHYYNEPDWFLTHADYYDEKNYSRDTDSMTDTKFGGGINVFLGEYAARSNTLRAALAEAAYMTGLERNGDIVKMAAYAPLFGNLTAMHWAPDLIWFNNHTSTSSINYYVQKIFGNNAGTSLLKSDFTGAEIVGNPFKGKVGVGTWSTSAEFDNVKIVNNETGEVLAQDDFSQNDFAKNWQKVSDGNWSVKNGKLIQASTNTDTMKYSTTGTVAYFGDTDWSNYTFTVDAVKIGGDEGFLIPFAVNNSRNNYFWNIGGWGNTVSCLQQVSNGTKSDQLYGTVKNCRLNTGDTYKLKVVVTDNNVKCYLNDTLYVDCDLPKTSNAESYQVVSTDKTGDIIIKMVNVTEYPKTFAIDIKGAETIGETASVDVVAGDSLSNDNILEKEEDVTLVSSEVSGIQKQFNYTVPQYSVTVLRVKTK